MESESEKARVLVELELKYCERCGGLWLRERGTEGVYCPTCLPRMMELPPPRKRRRGARVSLTNLGRIEGGLEGRIILWAQGGNA
jgi:reverse gyrase